MVESEAACRRLGYTYPAIFSKIGLHHHEAWDGRGYPDWLKGEKIPLGARMTAVAEAYGALTARRPYREDAWDSRVALNEIRSDVERGGLTPRWSKLSRSFSANLGASSGRNPLMNFSRRAGLTDLR